MIKGNASHLAAATARPIRRSRPRNKIVKSPSPSPTRPLYHNTRFLSCAEHHCCVARATPPRFRSSNRIYDSTISPLALRIRSSGAEEMFYPVCILSPAGR